MFVNNSFISKNEMTTYKITPDFRVTNNKNEVLSNVFSNLYEGIVKRVSLSNISFQQQNQVHFSIVMENRNIGFYLSFPTKFKELIEGKIDSCWKKCALDEVKDNSYLKINTVDTIGAELRFTDYNVFSIDTNLGDTSHLTSLLQILRAINEEEKVIINMAMESMPRYNWYSIVEDENNMIKRGEKRKVDGDFSEVLKNNIGKVGGELLNLYIEYKLLPFEILLGMVNDGSGGGMFDIREGERKLLARYEQEENHENSRQNHRKPTSEKRNSDVFKCKITILSSSKDQSKAKLNLLSIFESYKELNYENEFYLKELPHKKVISRVRAIQNFHVPMDNKTILSTKEVAKLIQLPPKQAQKDFQITSLDEPEGDISKELFKGNVPMAVTKIRGKEYIVYRSNDKSTRCLPWVVIGSQNVGKTTLMKRIAYENFKMGDSNLIIDTIEDCKIAKACRELIPKEKRVDIEISLTNVRNTPSFSFNEISSLITEDMDSFMRISLASDMAEQVQLIIENVSDDANGSLTDAMVRYLYSACLVTFIKPNATLNDVFDVLRSPEKRRKAIQYAQSTGCFEDEEVFLNLYQLDKEVKIKSTQLNEHGKEVEVTDIKIVNNDQAIVGINNRLTQLEKVPYVKRMLKQKPNKDENFLKYIEEGKTIVVSVPQHQFKSKKIRDMIGLYYFSRVWLAVQSRQDNENANPCHIFFDEVYTIPSTLKILEEHVTEFRRHRLGFFTSCHHLGQFRDTLTSFKSAGGNYILFSSAEKNSFNLLKEEISTFEYEDLLKLKEHHAIIVQRGVEGYSRYVGRIPNFLEDLSHIQNANKKE